MSWDSSFRLLWVIRLVGIGLISGMLLSWKLWITERLYPLFPVWEWVPPFSGSVSILVVLVFFGVVLWMMIKLGRVSLLLVFIFMLIFALQDQSRWQPWFYQYGLMLAPLLFVKDIKPYSKPLAGLLRFIVIMVYLWGGIHKCQPGWLSVWENSLVAPIIDGWKDDLPRRLLIGFGYLIPLIEILMAVGLCFKRTQRFAILMVLLTHVTILVLLGPVKGYISNSVVWPWNLVMMGMVVVLFYRQDELDLGAFRKTPLKYPGYGVAFVLIGAPVLYYFGLWDRYLSFSLYAGQQRSFLVRIDASAVADLPPEWSEWITDMQAVDGHLVLSPGTWSNQELNVPLISEWRILRAFSRKLCGGELAGTQPVFFVGYRHFPDKPQRYYLCGQIEEMIE